MDKSEIEKRFQAVIKELDALSEPHKAAGETERSQRECELLDELDSLEYQLHETRAE